MKLFCLVVFLPFVMMLGCKASRSASVPEPQPQTGRKPACGGGWIMNNELFTAPGFSLNIDTAYLDGRCLVVDVRRTGGCGSVSVDLIWNGSMMKSMPPQVPLRLLGRGEDPCRGEVRQQYRFEISTLNNGQALIIQLQGWKSPLHFGQP